MQAVVSIVGMLLGGLAVAMMMPIIADPADAVPFLEASAMTAFVAGGLYLGCRGWSAAKIGIREAYLLTSGAWVVLTVFAALPIVFSGYSVTDAVFEAVSGLTTTGSTILNGLDTMSPALLLWRALLQWVGGIGIIVTSIAILPLLRVGGMQLFRTESSASEKELPRAAKLAAATLWIYACLSVACAAAFWAAGMSGFDAIAHAMTTISTGGYSTHDLSMGYFDSSLIHWIAAAFMLAGGLPFVLYIKIVRNGSFTSVQARSLVKFLFVVIALLMVWVLQHTDMAPYDALTEVTFNVISVVTTTGFASSDYTTWGSFAVVVFFFLTFSGACTGSTSGGLKIMRILVGLKMCRMEMRKVAYPHGVYSEKYEKSELTKDVMQSVGVFIFVFVASVTVLALMLGVVGLDFETSLSGAATAIANVGPGIGPVIGPSGNFSSLPVVAKWLLCIGMLFGRLEFFTLLVLITPTFWRP